MSVPTLMLLLGGLSVLVLAIWIKRLQARFIAGLRAAGDPMADYPGTKPFRQKFQAWLFGLGQSDRGGSPVGRILLTAAMVLVLGAIAAWSLMPGILPGVFE
jgi:hypothetical protein